MLYTLESKSLVRSWFFKANLPKELIKKEWFAIRLIFLKHIWFLEYGEFPLAGHHAKLSGVLQRLGWAEQSGATLLWPQLALGGQPDA